MDIRSYLDQGKLWRVKPSADSTAPDFVQIADMTVEHRVMALRWLSGRAGALIWLVEASLDADLVSGDGDAELGDVLSLLAQDPKIWIRNTALFKALADGVPRSLWIPNYSGTD